MKLPTPYAVLASDPRCFCERGASNRDGITAPEATSVYFRQLITVFDPITRP